jgi:uncharacterized membrane protein
VEQNIIVTEPARNLRRMARAELKGHWKTACLAYMLYSVLILVPIILLSLIFDGTGAGGDFYFFERGIVYGDHDYSLGFGGIIVLLYCFIIVGPLDLGFSSFILALARGEAHGPGMILSGFGNLFKAFGLCFLRGLFTYLWALLFLVPGIIAAYAYTQAFFLLADDSRIGPWRALRQSRRLMKGNKGKFFCLQFSFIGWNLALYAACMLLILPFSLFSDTLFVFLFFFAFIVLPAPLVAYISTTYAIFYDILTGRRRLLPLDAAAGEAWRPIGDAGGETSGNGEGDR